MHSKEEINNLAPELETSIFLKIESIFKGYCGALLIDVPKNIETPNATFTISLEHEHKQLIISSIFKFDVFPKTFLSFSQLPEEKQICMETEEDAKIKEFFEKYYTESKSEIERLFKLIRWKYLLNHNKFEYLCENIFWSLDNTNWQVVVRCPAIESVNASAYSPRHFDTNMIKELFLNDEYEPIFLEILYEANDICRTSLESGFVIAVSALEVSVKYLIKNHIPKIEWIMDEIPSPPIHSIITEFFPQLIPGFILQKDNSTVLKSIIRLRNEILHSGKVGNDRKTLFKMMKFINDFILYTINPNLKS